MNLHILFGLSPEQRDDDLAPEAILVWDEYCVEGNPEGWNDAVAAAKEETPERDIREVIVIIDEEKLCNLFDVPKMKGELKNA